MIGGITAILCGILNAWGGYNWLPARRFIMPVLLGLSAFLITHVWWVGLLPIPSIIPLSCGYFGGGNFGHALRLFLCALAMALGITIFNHLSWFVFIPYVIGAGVLGGISKNWKQVPGDFINGFWLGSFLIFVR